MRAAGPVVRFLLWFALLYAALIAPWPGWNAAYGRYFRALNAGVFAREGPRRIVRFGEDTGPQQGFDTAITLADAGRTNAAGRMPARVLRLNSRSIGWIPTALFFALACASPVPWRRRARALALGLPIVHLFIVVSVGAYLWNESVSLGVESLSPWGRWVAAALEETLVTQLGVSFVAPALIWLAVTFRMSELGGFLSGGAVSDP